MNKVQQLFELQLSKSIKTVSYTNNIKYNELFNFVNNTYKFKYIEIIEDDNNELIKKKLIYLLDNVPSFIKKNKSLTNMTQCFIEIARKDNIDTSIITEDYINNLLISYIESII